MTVASSDDHAVAARLQPYLRPGEELLWCGRPDPGVIFSAADAIVIPFSIVWLGVALAFVAGSQSVGAPPAFRAVGILFVLIGIYLLAGRFVTRWLGKRRTVYGITGDRVLIQAGSSFRESPVKGGSMTVRRRRNGRHVTVAFEPFGSYYTYGPPTMTGAPMPDTGLPTMGPRTSRRVAPGAITFSDVPDPDALLAAINQAKSGAQR
jgi:membrane protein implicated in regulation of membrane protease activity